MAVDTATGAKLKVHTLSVTFLSEDYAVVNCISKLASKAQNIMLKNTAALLHSTVTIG